MAAVMSRALQRSGSVSSKPDISASRLSRSDTLSGTSAIKMRRPNWGLARNRAAIMGSEDPETARTITA